MRTKPGEMVMNQSHEPEMGGAERTQNVGGNFCNLVPSSSPDSAAWCCVQVGGCVCLSPLAESCVCVACMQWNAQARVSADKSRSPSVPSGLGLTH